MQAEASRDKDYSFARLCDLTAEVTLRMWVILGRLRVLTIDGGVSEHHLRARYIPQAIQRVSEIPRSGTVTRTHSKSHGARCNH